MSADAIVYCLEHLTDYRQFERLCSDIMNQSGYHNIEVLGGSNDGGRDALHISQSDSNDITIFAYSTRSDWQRKLLKEDCERIANKKHALARLAFACTASITASQRDWAVQQVHDQFGWTLDLYDLERIRVRLVGDLRHLIAQHPAIFCPPFFPTRGGVSISESRDTLVIDHMPSDHALATWLARRLQLAGYRTWCYGTAPLAGETADDTIRILQKKRTLRYLPILSSSSVANADFLGRCALASATDELSLPCVASEFNASCLPTRLGNLTPVAFTDGYAAGLAKLLTALDSKAIKPTLEPGHGRSIALRSYVPQPVTRTMPETVYSSTFGVTLPAAIYECQLTRPLEEAEIEEFRKRWAFCLATPTMLLAFERPPAELPLEPFRRLPAYDWTHFPFRHEKRSVDVVKELIRRSLDVACVCAGLQWCASRRVYYFPSGEKPLRFVPFTHVDGRKTRVAVTGEQNYGFGDRAIPFRYQLSPSFRAGQDESGQWWVTLRVYVRVTDRDGNPYEGKAVGVRRKKVGKSWWNQEWFARIVGVMQALGNGHDEIVIGSGSEQVTVAISPLSWQCPVSIDYLAVEKVGDFQEEMASMRYVEDDETHLANTEEEQEGNG